MRLLEQITESWANLDQQTRLRAGYWVVIVLALAVGWSALSARVAALEKKLAAREAVLKELLPLKMQYKAARLSSDRLAGQVSTLRPDDTPAKIIDEIGIRGKAGKIAPAKGDDRPGFVEDASDVRIDGLTVNEALNLIYRLEKGGRPLLLKKCNLRLRFDDPARCDLALVMALLKPAPAQAR